jgi:hypothetical protein
LAVWKQLVPEIARQRDLGPLDDDSLRILCVFTYELRQHEQAGTVPARLYSRWIVLARNFGLIGPRIIPRPALGSKVNRLGLERDEQNRPISAREQRRREEARRATLTYIRTVCAKLDQLPNATPREKPTEVVPFFQTRV